MLSGNLYIAQPPLFKAKKGKKENYLKNEKNLFQYLVEQGTEKMEVKARDSERSDESADAEFDVPDPDLFAP